MVCWVLHEMNVPCMPNSGPGEDPGYVSPEQGEHVLCAWHHARRVPSVCCVILGENLSHARTHAKRRPGK